VAESGANVRTFDCIRERVIRWTPRDPYVPDGKVWHIAPHRGRSADFCPILCSKNEGITLPGHVVRREPTCPDCIALSAGDIGRLS
jgi:hypothetical protein